ncbi:MAG: L-asparaginase [Rhodospirillaceae bacterium]|nr:L-asparaginase [Rhodospirillaceae bacterium]
MEFRMKPTVKVFSLGGTIASSGDKGKGVSPTLGADTLINAIPGISEKVKVKAENFRQLPSPHITFDDIQELVKAINKDIDLGVDGVVVTHGTDTLEESAFLIDLIYKKNAPVVLTGAMRNPTLPGADGPANLHDAVMVASDRKSKGKGVLLVFNSEIHAARYVNKCHTQNVNAFRSKPLGPIGWISENSVRILSSPMPTFSSKFTSNCSMARVALLKTAMADDGSLVNCVISDKYEGLVVEATGGGHVTPKMVKPIIKATKVMPVVLVSRTGNGENLRETYMFPGSEIYLYERGVLNGGWLDGLKARILLSLLIGSGANNSEIKKVFESYIDGKLS